MGLWASRKACERRRSEEAAKSRPHPTTREEFRQAVRDGEIPPRWNRGLKSPAKQCWDRLRMESFEEQRKERLALFGYVKTKNGLTYTIAKATILLEKGELRPEDIETWQIPESFTDVLNSIGERDAMADYPALGIVKGTVLRDPKIRVPGGHTDPALRRRPYDK